MTQTEFDKIRTGITFSCFTRKRQCFITNCDKTAIQSHLVQRSGVLKQIIANNHFYEVTFLQFPTLHYDIKRVGHKKGFTFSGFCFQHDHQIFLPIENQINIDFENYQSLLLLSCRPLLQEYREKQNVTEALIETVVHPQLIGLLDVGPVNTAVAGETFLMWDVEFMLNCIQEDLDNDSQHFIFSVISIPKVEVCAFAIISFTPLANSFLTESIDINQKELIPGLLFHLVPTSSDTKLVLGYNKLSEEQLKPKIDKLKSLDTTNLLKEISDILIRNCGKWACSEKFYIKNIVGRKDKLLRLVNYFTKRQQFSNEPIDFNLFLPI